MHAPGVTGVTVGVRAEHIRLDGDVVDRVELVEVAGADAYVHLASGLVATTDAEARPAPGDDVSIGIRPEDVHLFDEGTGERVGPA